MLYEDQAASFDQRAGIPADAALAVADAVATLVASRDERIWLEVGAGTGQLSLPLVAAAPGYVGIDRSPAMLAVFRERLDSGGLDATLHEGDGDEPWPVEDGSAAVVFCARALHHLEPAHVAAESLRVLGAAGGWLVLGRVRRPPDSPRAVLRRRMRRLLKAQGRAGRSHDATADAVFALLADAGGEVAPTLVAARWTRAHRPADSLEGWAAKNGLAGIEIPARAKARVLTELRTWALARYGDLSEPLTQEEHFELSAVRVPPRPVAGD
jgi:ubiquinone/menaquinone biosynthesis C-methylase UbiE